MSNIDATPSNEPQLTAEVTATGTAPRPTNLIAPEHKHHADAILAMDPMQIPRPYDIPEGWAANLTLRATALPPEMQRSVTAKVAALGNLTPEQRSAKEAEFTADVIRSQRSNLIVQGGVGRDATPYHRELASIAREVSDLYRQYDALQAELDHVVRYDTETDPITGEPKPIPVYAVTGQRAAGCAEQQQDLLRRVRLLVEDDGTPGIEGAKRTRQALAESVAARVELDRQLSEEAEAKRRAEAINREKRINDRAESLARLNRNGS